MDKFPSLKQNSFFKSKIGIFISISITQYLVFLTWLAFRIRNFDELLYSMQKYIFLDFQINETLEIISVHKVPVLLIILFITLHYISYKKVNLLDMLAGLKLRYWILFLITKKI